VTSDLQKRFPGLQALGGYVHNIRAEESGAELEEFGESVFSEVRQKYTLDSVKDVPAFRAYRDFFWKVGIDPTKVRPASEALIRRILAGKAIPKINNVVDAYNLASVKTEIALAAFDHDRLKGELVMRQASPGERFLGIGMREPTVLNGKEVVIQDSEKLVAIYPHRDAETSKVSQSTSNILILACGVPQIDTSSPEVAKKVAASYIIRFSGGTEQE
jgi:DNA/RNA-binding domain of Phe-tRNA-synthetase-like protein